MARIPSQPPAIPALQRAVQGSGTHVNHMACQMLRTPGRQGHVSESGSAWQRGRRRGGGIFRKCEQLRRGERKAKEVGMNG